VVLLRSLVFRVGRDLRDVNKGTFSIDLAVGRLPLFLTCITLFRRYRETEGLGILIGASLQGDTDPAVAAVAKDALDEVREIDFDFEGRIDGVVL